MSSKLLIVFGIIVAHGALAAGWMKRESPQPRALAASSCSRSPGAMPDFTPRPMLLAALISLDSRGETRQP